PQTLNSAVINEFFGHALHMLHEPMFHLRSLRRFVADLLHLHLICRPETYPRQDRVEILVFGFRNNRSRPNQLRLGRWGKDGLRRKGRAFGVSRSWVSPYGAQGSGIPSYVRNSWTVLVGPYVRNIRTVVPIFARLGLHPYVRLFRTGCPSFSDRVLF